MTEPDFPKITLGIEGGMSVDYAPDVASFPLTWLLDHERSKGYIETVNDLVKFLQSDGDPVVYKIVSFDVGSKRFTGKKVTPHE